MASRPTLTVTFAVAGSGKTYIRGARFVSDEFLGERSEGVHYSNFPLKVDAIAEHCAKRSGKPADEFRSRIFIIPNEEIQAWGLEQTGPWEYFKDVDLQNAHIAIDEAHNVCGEKHSAGHRRKWQQWLGELRHRGACCELISQDEGKVAREVVKEAGQRICLINSESRRDPFFGITCGEWYELRAGLLTGEYEAAVWEVEQRRVMSRWNTERERKFRFEQAYFDLYDSYNTPHGGGVKATTPPHEFMRRTKLGLVGWFVRRNAWSLSWRPCVAAVVVWLLLFGGWRVAATEFAALVKSYMPKKAPKGEVVEPTHPPGAFPGYGEPTLADPVEVATRLRRELTDAEAAVASFKTRAETAEALARKLAGELGAGFRLTLINHDVCTFQNGVSYRVGETIEDGPYKGKVVESLDWPRRRVVLTGGQVVQLGATPPVDLAALDVLPPITAAQPGFAPDEKRKPLDTSGLAPVPLDPDRMRRASAQQAPASASTGLSGPLPPDVAAGIRAAREEWRRTNGNPVGQRNASSSVLPMGQQSSRGFYSSGAVPR
jgi:hypothetical protein